MENDFAYPTAEKTTSSLTGATLTLPTVKIPAGKYVSKTIVAVDVTTSGTAGTGTDQIAKLVEDLSIRNEEDVPVLHAGNGYALGMVAYLCAALFALASGMVPRKVVSDEALAGDDTYYAAWEIMHGLKGREFTPVIKFGAASGLSGYSTTPTGITINVRVWFELSYEQPMAAQLDGAERDTMTEYETDAFSALVGIDGTAISTAFKTLKFGNDTFSSESIEMLETATARLLAGAGAAGGQKPIAGSKAPSSATDLNAALLSKEDVNKLTLTCSSSTLLIGKIAAYKGA